MCGCLHSMLAHSACLLAASNHVLPGKSCLAEKNTGHIVALKMHILGLILGPISILSIQVNMMGRVSNLRAAMQARVGCWARQLHLPRRVLYFKVDSDCATKQDEQRGIVDTRATLTCH